MLPVHDVALPEHVMHSELQTEHVLGVLESANSSSGHEERQVVWFVGK